MVQERENISRSGNKKTVFKGMGPIPAYTFCQTQRFKKYGPGSGALMAPGKGLDRSDILTIAIPPITVTHIQPKHKWTAQVEMFLWVFTDSGRFTLPANANVIDVCVAPVGGRGSV